MKTIDYFKVMILSGSLFATSLFADGDPQISTAIGSYKFDAKTGEEIYRASCQGCHMADGKGAYGAGFYPSLAGDELLASAETALEIVAHGLRGMPSFRDYLSDEQIVEVVKYIRTSFGNNFEGDVKTTDIPK
ncbi:MAG: cytochrome c [Campylobacteraceae bacterium]|jgi:mono/diheme cytochrome c family protein|nr:cytochrome c [Campylobacteraceae bacterium]